MATSSHFLQYRAAIALNNMATTLMQKGCYEAASRTLSDSLKLIQMTNKEGEAEQGNDNDCARTTSGKRARSQARKSGCFTDRSPREIFQSASRRFSHHAFQRHSIAPPVLRSSRKRTTTTTVVEVNPIDDDDIAGLQAAVRYGQSSAMVFPVRIVSFASWSSSSCVVAAGENCMGDDTVAATTKDILTKQLGIILYNHGLAAFLVSMSSESSSTTNMSTTIEQGNVLSLANNKMNRKYSKHSQKSLNMAETTFSLSLKLAGHQQQQQQQHHHWQGPHRHQLETTEQDYSIILLIALTLNVEGSIFHAQGLTFHAKEAQHTASLLFSTFEKDYVFWDSILSEIHPCAPMA
ncbi:hypothetical protein ACA910_007476 [Epithemia clementina (nom. ined.)]